MNVLIFATALVVTYYVMAIMQTLLHRAFGHRNIVRRIFAGHSLGHHRDYRKDALLSDRYIDSEVSVVSYYGIPVVIFGMAVLIGGNLVVFGGYCAGAALAFWLHYYLHEQYHLSGSRLERFAWFRRKRELHFVHHRYVRRNYAIVEFWIDRLAGTLQESSSASAHAKIKVQHTTGQVQFGPNRQTTDRGALHAYTKTGHDVHRCRNPGSVPTCRHAEGGGPCSQECLRLHG